MKKIKMFGFCILMVCVLSCQKENSQDDVTSILVSQNENWLSAKLDAKFASSQKKIAGYLLPSKQMKLLVEKPNITEVHFVLGFIDNTIQIEVTGVDKSGIELGTVKSVILKESNFRTEQVKLNELSVSVTKKRTSLLNSHLLSPNDAFVWIEEWQKKLNSVSDLEEVISFEGSRFRYFSLEAEIIKAMLYKDNANIGVFLGLNPKGKVTTILIGLDDNNKIKRTSITSREEAEDIYDGTRPCPPCVIDDTEEEIPTDK